MPKKKKPENWELKILPLDHDLKKSWFIQLEYTDPLTGEKDKKQYRNGINYFKTVPDRLREAEALVDALTLKLTGGWNPITNTVVTVSAETSFEKLPLNQALDIAIEGKRQGLSHKSFLDIMGVVKFAKAAAIKLRLHITAVGTIRKKHIKLILDQVAKDRQAAYTKAGKGQVWTGNSYNKYRGFLSILFTELEDLEAVEFNPCAKIANKPEIKTNAHRHATDRETKLIKDHLQKENINFFIYLATEYMTGVRPKELFGIRVCDIDWLNQCFDIQATDGRSKTKAFRKVPIPNALTPYLKRMRLEFADPDDFIFSEDFKPGKIRKRRVYATNLWQKMVKEDLGINVTLYSFKGLGGEDKRKAGISATSVGSQYGHGSINMTHLYLHGEQDRINKEIIEKTPHF